MYIFDVFSGGFVEFLVVMEIVDEVIEGEDKLIDWF